MVRVNVLTMNGDTKSNLMAVGCQDGDINILDLKCPGQEHQV